MKERDVLLQGKENGQNTIDLPITRLRNIEDGAEVKDAPEAGDYIPVLDGSAGGQMKKMPWEAVGQLVEDAITQAVNEAIEDAELGADTSEGGREGFPEWKEISLPSSADWRGVAYGNGKFVAVAYDSDEAAYSPDGINWESAILPSLEEWSSVAYGDGKFVAVADGKNITIAAYSTDGITWNEATLPTPASWKAVTYGGGKFVAVTYSNAAAYSSDGINWTQMTMPSSYGYYCVAYGNGNFVAMGAYVAYSADGINWTEGTNSISANGITYGNGKFVAVNGGYAAYSPDGITWAETDMPSSNEWNSVAYGNGYFVAVAYGKGQKAAYSTDGITWTGTNIQFSASSITYGNGKFVALEDGGDTGAYAAFQYVTYEDLDERLDGALLPPGGTEGQVLTKSANGDAEWANVGGGSLPSGGTTGQALVKASDADGDTEWAGVVLSEAVKTAQVLTEAEYNALTTKDPTTLYIMPEE